MVTSSKHCPPGVDAASHLLVPRVIQYATVIRHAQHRIENHVKKDTRLRRCGKRHLELSTDKPTRRYESMFGQRIALILWITIVADTKHPLHTEPLWLLIICYPAGAAPSLLTGATDVAVADVAVVDVTVVDATVSTGTDAVATVEDTVVVNAVPVPEGSTEETSTVVGVTVVDVTVVEVPLTMVTLAEVAVNNTVEVITESMDVAFDSEVDVTVVIGASEDVTGSGVIVLNVTGLPVDMGVVDAGGVIMQLHALLSRADWL